MIPEKCPKCGWEDFAVVRDMKATRYCKCGHTWLPPRKLESSPPPTSAPALPKKNTSSENINKALFCLGQATGKLDSYICLDGKNEALKEIFGLLKQTANHLLSDE